MNTLLLFLSFFILLFIILFIIMTSKIRKLSAQLRNRAHFYVARDKDDGLYLYMGKLIRKSDEFIICNGGNIIGEAKDFLNYGLNENDYANLKWEDEPLEVFVNMED